MNIAKPFTEQEMDAARWRIARSMTLIMVVGVKEWEARNQRFPCCPEDTVSRHIHERSYQHIANKFGVSKHRLRKAVAVLSVLEVLSPAEGGDTKWKKA